MTAMVCLMILWPTGFAQLRTGENSLTIEVTDTSGVPIKNACVTFVPKDGEILFRKADKRGRVRLKKPLPGTYRVVVKVDGYEAQKREVAVTSWQPQTMAFLLHVRKDK